MSHSAFGVMDNSKFIKKSLDKCTGIDYNSIDW